MPSASRAHPTGTRAARRPPSTPAEAVAPSGHGPLAVLLRHPRDHRQGRSFAKPRGVGPGESRPSHTGRAPWLGRARTRNMRPRRGNPPLGSARRAPSGHANATRKRRGRGDRRSRARASQGALPDTAPSVVRPPGPGARVLEGGRKAERHGLPSPANVHASGTPACEPHHRGRGPEAGAGPTPSV